ncbi:hypothetical protein FOCC_FOCC006614 [Frankliniella occidentalis]|nr:hypothetical protein FOCC_FOCC006614 [Frankliniella occidentalis]
MRMLAHVGEGPAAAQVVMVVLALLRWQWRTLRSLGAALLAGAVGGGGAPSALLLATLCLWPFSAGLVASASPPPTAPPLPSLASLLQRVRAGLPGLPSPPRAVRDTMDALLDLATSAASPTQAMSRAMQIMPPLNEDVTSADILRAYGYPAETHFLWTEDGYRLQLNRVAPPSGGGRRQPLLLAHGMQTASPCFLLTGKEKSLATMLYDAGYDVWLLNYRGTHYSTGHRNLSVNSEEFWKFSFHEHGVYDNPAVIDFVLERTGFPSLVYVSHSMGSTSFMIMASMRPEYNDKILAAHLMAPAGPLHHHRSPFVGVLQGLNNVTTALLDRLRLHHTMSLVYRLFRRLGSMLHSVPGVGALLYAFTYTIVGYNPQAEYYGFRRYDHGRKRNVEMYGSAVPPLYELSNIRAPVHLYLAHNDVLCADKDMEYLRSQFRNLASVQYAPDPKFNHMDFFAARTADRQVYLPMLKQMRRDADAPSPPADGGATADNALPDEDEA